MKEGNIPRIRKKKKKEMEAEIRTAGGQMRERVSEGWL